MRDYRFERFKLSAGVLAVPNDYHITLEIDCSKFILDDVKEYGPDYRHLTQPRSMVFQSNRSV